LRLKCLGNFLLVSKVFEELLFFIVLDLHHIVAFDAQQSYSGFEPFQKVNSCLEKWCLLISIFDQVKCLISPLKIVSLICKDYIHGQKAQLL